MVDEKENDSLFGRIFDFAADVSVRNFKERMVEKARSMGLLSEEEAGRLEGLAQEVIDTMSTDPTSPEARPRRSFFGRSGVKGWMMVLGVTPHDDFATVKKTYRELAARYHTDNARTGDKQLYIEVQDAWAEAKEHFRES